MTIRLEQLRPGQVLYHVQTIRAGKSGASRSSCLPVKIIEIHLPRAEVVVSYNGGPHARWPRKHAERLRLAIPKEKPTRRRR